MILSDARSAVQQILGYEPLDHFVSEVLGREALFVQGDAVDDRAAFLGPDPADTLLDAHVTHGATLTCHAHAPIGPPPPKQTVPDRADFAALIGRYHALGYTVRFPNVVQLSERLQLMIRALEIVLEKPVEAAVFWSAPGAKAPVHYDEYDIVVLQLQGSKRWFVSTDPPGLNNQWKRAGEVPPTLERYRTITMNAGDFAYLPRGTPHTVESLTESIHLSIGFVPVTLRDTIIAAIDLMSDLDRPLRSAVSGNAMAGQVRAALDRLLAACDQPFVDEAMDLRRARMVFDLPKLPAGTPSGPFTATTVVRHTPLAIAHLITTHDLVNSASQAATSWSTAASKTVCASSLGRVNSASPTFPARSTMTSASRWYRSL